MNGSALNVYILYNKKAAYWFGLNVSSESKEHLVQALARQFKLDPGAMVKQHLHECDLYLVGTFDDISGKFDLLDQKEFIVSLDQFLEVKEING